MNYYEILGLDRNAEGGVVDAAYKAMMRKYHPDRYQGDKEVADRRSKLINEAYAILRDPQKRAAYDELIGAQEEPDDDGRKPPEPEIDEPFFDEDPLGLSKRTPPKSKKPWIVGAFATFAFFLLVGLLDDFTRADREQSATVDELTLPTADQQLPTTGLSQNFELPEMTPPVDPSHLGNAPAPVRTRSYEPTGVTDERDFPAIPIDQTSSTVAGSSIRAQSLNGFTREERESLELACFNAKIEGPASYNRCLQHQAAEARNSPGRPNTDALSREENESLELACFNAKIEGPASYNRCLRLQLDQLNR